MPIKKQNEQSLGEAIKEMIEAYRIGSKLSEAKMLDSWEKIVGSMIAKHTVQMKVSKRKLYVKLDSAALRSELTYAREKIRKSLNKEVGENLIDEVIFN